MKKYPKIGIRPTIDGRQGGVRESLEEKTMNLAKAVAELISSNLKNGDGSPVECVIADNTIGRVAESAACAEKFEREGVGSTITVTSCWCYGAETMDRTNRPSAAAQPHHGTTIPQYPRLPPRHGGQDANPARPMPLRTQPFPCRGSATVQRRGAPICKTACTAYSKETSLKRPVPKNARRQAWPLPSLPASTTGASCIDRPAPCPCTGLQSF